MKIFKIIKEKEKVLENIDNIASQIKSLAQSTPINNTTNTTKDLENNITEDLKALIQEKIIFSNELERINSMILTSESASLLVRNKRTVDIPGGLERRLLRYSISKSSTDFKDDNFLMNIIRAQKLPQIKTKEHERADSIAEQSFDIERKYFDISKVHKKKESLVLELGRTDSMLLEKIENISQLFEGFDPRQSIFFEDGNLIRESFSFLNTNDIPKDDPSPLTQKMLILIEEQDKIIDSLQHKLIEKDDQLEIVQDELNLCRNNLANMQKQLKSIKRQSKEN